MSYGDVNVKSNSKFLKVEADIAHDVRLIDPNPTEMYEHSTQPKPTPCKGEELCSLCADGDEPIQKFLTNVYDHTLKRVMIWKYGGGVGKQLKALANSLKEESGDIMQVDIKISATGSGQQKRYTITPRMTAKPLPENVKRHELEGETPF